MAEAIKKWLASFQFAYPRSVFDMSPGERRYVRSRYRYPSIEESWAQDWANIGCDFRRAVGRFQGSFA